MEKNFNKLNQKTMKSLQELSQTDGEKMQAFNNLVKSVESGSLDLKTKELIVIALAVKSQCSYCIGLHVKKAISSGASKDEIMQACWLAVMMGGGPSLMYVQEVQKAIEEFS